MTSTHSGTTQTRTRVLEAAGEIFADKGYEKTTIREIVDAAGANLNAVNYYFGGKRELYHALFEHAHRTLLARHDEGVLPTDAQAPPAQRLERYVERLLRGFVLTKRASWQMRLMMREMIEPTGVLDIMVERFIRPRFEVLTAIVRDLLPGGADHATARLCALSVVGQCAHVAQRRPVVMRLVPELDYSPEGLKRAAQHITAFSLAGIRDAATRESNV